MEDVGIGVFGVEVVGRIGPPPRPHGCLRWEIPFGLLLVEKKQEVETTTASLPLLLLAHLHPKDVKTVLTANSNSNMGEAALNTETKEWQGYSKKCSGDQGTKGHNDIKHIKKNVVNSTNSNAWVHMIFAINFTYIELPDVRPVCWSDAT